MQPTGQPAGDQRWEPSSLEVDPADAQERSRELLDDGPDPEVSLSVPRHGPDVDLTAASEADLAEQLREIEFDDDGER